MLPHYRRLARAEDVGRACSHPVKILDLQLFPIPSLHPPRDRCPAECPSFRTFYFVTFKPDRSRCPKGSLKMRATALLVSLCLHFDYFPSVHALASLSHVGDQRRLRNTRDGLIRPDAIPSSPMDGAQMHKSRAPNSESVLQRLPALQRRMVPNRAGEEDFRLRAHRPTRADQPAETRT